MTTTIEKQTDWKEARKTLVEKEIVAIDGAVYALEKIVDLFDTRGNESTVHGCLQMLQTESANRKKKIGYVE